MAETDTIRENCPLCETKLLPRCEVCKKGAKPCRNEYCSGAYEYACVPCKKIFEYKELLIR